jgi:hypothetical protein
MAVLWLRRLVTSRSPRRPGLDHVGFVVDKVALGQVSLRVLQLSPVNIIPPGLRIHISSRAVFLNLSGATDSPLSLVCAADPLPKTVLYIYIKYNTLKCRITDIIINRERKYVGAD